MHLPPDAHKNCSTINGSTFLECVVVPAVEEQLGQAKDQDNPSFVVDRAEDGTPYVEACWRGTQLARVSFTRRDEKSATLSFALHTGTYLDSALDAAVALGSFVESTPFRVSFGHPLFLDEQVTLCSDLEIHASDGELVRERTCALFRLAFDIDWFCSLYLPHRLAFFESTILSQALEQSESATPLEFLEAGLAQPQDVDHARVLAVAAKGLGRWKDVLRAVGNATSPAADTWDASLAMRAWQVLGRPKRALEAARMGEMDEGRYPGAPCLSPCYLTSLIETGDDIEALRLLGRPEDGEPAFYDLLRGKALFAAGDKNGSKTAFERYIDQWPGDLIAQGEACQLFLRNE